MAGLDKTIVDFSESGLAGSGVVAVGATSTSAALPAATELLMLTCSATSAHFRCGVGTQTAVVTDPMITSGIVLVIKLNPTLQYNLAVIGDTGVTTGLVAFCRVMEG